MHTHKATYVRAQILTYKTKHKHTIISTQKHRHKLIHTNTNPTYTNAYTNTFTYAVTYTFTNSWLNVSRLYYYKLLIPEKYFENGFADVNPTYMYTCP